jgi:hypothetical protein
MGDPARPARPMRAVWRKSTARSHRARQRWDNAKSALSSATIRRNRCADATVSTTGTTASAKPTALPPARTVRAARMRHLAAARTTRRARSPTPSATRSRRARPTRARHRASDSAGCSRSPAPPMRDHPRGEAVALDPLAASTPAPPFCPASRTRARRPCVLPSRALKKAFQRLLALSSRGGTRRPAPKKRGFSGSPPHAGSPCERSGGVYQHPASLRSLSEGADHCRTGRRCS